MPKDDIPVGLKPYVFHGLDFYEINGSSSMTTCPFCGKEKFSVDSVTSVFHCWVCDSKGNATVFVNQLFEEASKVPNDYSSLVIDRGISESTFETWGVVKSPTTDQWLIPGYGADGALRQLYKYCRTNKGMRLLATPTLKHQLHGMNLFNKKKQKVYILEGPWDGMILWQMLSVAKDVGEGQLRGTGNTKQSLIQDVNVLAFPGCNVFVESWLPLFNDRTVTVLFDNDHPKTNTQTGKESPPTGWAATTKLAGKILRGGKPRELRVLQWGPEGYDPELPNGHDVRDYLQA